MNFIHAYILKAKQITSIGWVMLLLLMCGAGVKSILLAFWDIGTVGLYLGAFDRVYLAFDLMLAAIFMAVAGYYTLLFDRRQGYGCVPVCAFVGVILILFIWGVDTGNLGALRVLFILKYAVFILLTASFWSVASRFIPVRLDSLKMLLILCAELGGFVCAGFFATFLPLAFMGLLIAGVFLFLVFLIILKTLVYLNPMPSETFIQKQGGAQDAPGLKLVYYIFWISFACMCARAGVDYAFYTVLIGQDVLVYLGLLWGLFGALGILCILLLYRTRYLYTTVLGMLILAGSLVLIAIGSFLNSLNIVFVGTLVFLLACYFYMNAFLNILPRPIAIGNTARIKKKRLLIMEPLGFLFAALVLYYFEEPLAQGLFLLCIAGALFILIHLSVTLYSTILLDSFKCRQWRGGPLMIALPKLYAYILDGLKSEDPDEVVYFIRILAISKHASYKKNLLKLIKHPSPIVRLFALNRIALLKQSNPFQKTIQMVAQKDVSTEVRCRAISMLIQVDYDRDLSVGIDKYISLLTDKKLRSGVLLGFLRLGGDPALLAMEGLQKMIFSKKTSDNIQALKIIQQVPLAGLVRLVEPFMKNPDLKVAQQALLTAGAMKHSQLLPAIFEALDDTELQEYALVALKEYGKLAFPPLEKMLHNPSVSAVRKKILILFLNALGSGEGKQILIRSISVDGQKLRRIIMNSLINSGIVWIHTDKKKLLITSLNKDIHRIHMAQHFIETQTQALTHETEEAYLFLRRALIEDIADTRELILLQLQLLKPHPLFAKAIRILLSDRTDRYEAALGAVQDFLPSNLYRQIKPIILMPMDVRKTPLPDRVILEEHAVQTLCEFILKPPFKLPPWIKATALYALRKLGYEEGKVAVLASLSDKNPVVLEAAIWALVRLEKDANELHKALLNVPTSQLALQSIEEILKS